MHLPLRVGPRPPKTTALATCGVWSRALLANTIHRVKAKTGLIAWLQYALVRFAVAMLRAIPLGWNLGIARHLAKGWARFMPRHRNLAINHLTESFPEKCAREIERIADACLEHWTMLAVEIVCAPDLITRTTWFRHVRLVGFEETLELILSGRPLIFAAGHYGHFELPGHLLAALGFDIAAVMRPLDNVYLNRFVVATRRRHGLRLIDKKGAMTQAEQILANGTMLAFIADQNAGRKGIFVDFFGRPASTYKSIGLLAMATETPIAVGYARRIGSGFEYEIGVERILHPHEWKDQDDPLRWITQTYTAAIESVVRARPEQYLWIHKRWKSKPKQRRKPRLGA